MTDDQRKAKAGMLREYAGRIRKAAGTPTLGGSQEDKILDRLAERLERDAAALEAGGAVVETVREPRIFPPMP